jgi:hypothetical protein
MTPWKSRTFLREINPTDELVPMAKTQKYKYDSIVVSALRARTNFGKLLQRVESERHSLVIEKREAAHRIRSPG